jgi:hypothetical protein
MEASMDARILTISLAIVLLGCATPDTEQNFSNALHDNGLREDDVRIVEAAVRLLLKDPGSAQFRDLTAAGSEDGHKFVCGWVDYKKPSGALVGEEPFSGTLFAGQFVVGNLARDQAGAATVFAECQVHNVPM